MDRYIKAMEIGLSYEHEGISYFDLKKVLEKELNLKLEKLSEVTFLFWFIESFSNGHFEIFKYNQVSWKIIIQEYFENGTHSKGKKFVDNILTDLNNKWFIKGEAAMQYYDYLKLKQAQESSVKALEKADESILLAEKSTNFAAWALGISIVTSIASIVLSVIALNKKPPEYPQPPYEVKLNQPVKLDDESIDKIRVLTKKDSITK